MTLQLVSPTEPDIDVVDAFSADTPTLNPTLNPTPSLRRDSTWMFAGNAIYAVSQWGLLAVLARLGTTEMVGEWIFALSITMPVMALCMLHLRCVLATDARHEYRFGDYLAMRIIGMLSAVIVIVCIGFIARFELDPLAILGATTGIAVVDGFSDICYGFLQHRGQLTKVSRSMIAKGLLSVLAFGLTTLLSGWFFYGLLAVLFVRATILLAYDRANIKSILAFEAELSAPYWQADRLRMLFRLAIPLGTVMMLIVLCGNIPRYFLDNHYGDKSMLGIFGAIGYVSVAGSLLIGAIGESSNVRLAKDYGFGRIDDYKRLTFELVAIASVVGLLGVLCAFLIGERALNLLYGPGYAAQAATLTWVMIAAGIGYVASIFGYAISAARYFRSQLPLFAFVTTVTVLASFFLIPHYGLEGAAYALVTSSIAQLVGVAFIFRHAINTAIDRESSFNHDARLTESH